MWTIVFTPRAKRDARKLAAAGLKENAIALLDVIREDPFANPPSFEKLRGNLDGLFSRRINIHNRLVYQVLKKERVVKVLAMWTHYE